MGATELFNIVIQLETDKYDYEQKRGQQERDLQELKERQKAQLRQKALKKGLDPEALVGKYPPMIRMYSSPTSLFWRRSTVHFHFWRISCCNKYDFYSWYGSNDSDGTINSKEHYFCYNTNVKLCYA